MRLTFKWHHIIFIILSNTNKNQLTNDDAWYFNKQQAIIYSNNNLTYVNKIYIDQDVFLILNEICTKSKYNV